MESNPEICKELLELLLNIKIDRIEKPVTERSMKIDYDSKGIRFDVYVKDGTTKIFFNASKYDIMPTEQLKSFFSFLNGKNGQTPLTNKLNDMVKRAKVNAQWRYKFMTWEQEIKSRAKQAFNEGKQEGINTEKLNVAKTMLCDNIPVEKIQQYTGLTQKQITTLQHNSDM